MKCLCLGPKRAGKTHLLKALQDQNSIDETTYSMPTNGTNIFSIKFPLKPHGDGREAAKQPPPPPATEADGNEVPIVCTDPAQIKGKTQTQRQLIKSIRVMEIGGAMAPIWRQYFEEVDKLIYVVDTSNLCQISAAGVLFYSLLAEPRLQKVKILVVLTKMDYAYRQMRNEALLMLQMSKLRKEIRQNVTIVEASAVSKVGLDIIYEWLQKT